MWLHSKPSSPSSWAKADLQVQERQLKTGALFFAIFRVLSPNSPIYPAMKSKWFVVSCVFLALATLTVRAEVKANGLISEGAVLQQGIAVPIWGTARDGEKVTVKFQDQEVSTVAKNGKWMVKLKALKAGGPFKLTIIGDNTLTFENMLVGEVWLCSGQSNMAFQLARAANAREAIAAAGDEQLRLFSVRHNAVDAPLTDVEGRWKASAPNTASNFSAVAYFFGRDLRKTLKVPVGLIESSVGGTPAEAWTDRATLEKDPELKKILEEYAESVKRFDPVKLQEQRRVALSKYQDKVKLANARGEPTPTPPAAITDPAKSSKRPCGLYNGMIAPLEPYAMRGVIWYQGEANVGRAKQYETLFPAMINNWRTVWGQGKFPFLFVQITPHQSKVPEIREAQLVTAQKVPKTAIIVTTDVGNATDIHPTKKEPVGARLALAARAVAYGEKIEYSGPVYDSLKVKGDKAIVSFEHIGSGLMAQGGELKGFTIAGKDGNFQPAKATIEGEKVVVSVAGVSKPVAVRYGWVNVPDVNLYNREGLPASPFRSDRK